MTLDQGIHKDPSGVAPCAGATTPGAGRAGAGREPLAVAVVDRDGLVAQWSSGARRLFGVTEEHALGRPALDLLPVSGAFPFDDEHAATAPRRAVGRARLSAPDGGRVDVLWWAYPLAGPGRDGLLVLATDAEGLRPGGTEWRLALAPLVSCEQTGALQPVSPRG